MVRCDVNSSNDTLLCKFNERDNSAFTQVYSGVFDEVNHFTKRLFYYSNLDSKDLIQDIFAAMWSNESLQFTSLAHIKNYLFLAIKNKHKNHLKHSKHVANYEKQSENYCFSTMVESSTLSILSEAMSYLPDDCATIFKLYIEGWEIKDIAQKMNKSESAIYSRRNHGIKILKKKLDREKLLILFLFFK